MKLKIDKVVFALSVLTYLVGLYTQYITQASHLGSLWFHILKSRFWGSVPDVRIFVDRDLDVIRFLRGSVSS